MYIRLAAELLSNLSLKAAHLASRRIFSPDPPIDLAQANAKVQELLAHGDGSDGLRYAHACWQSLKHPWADVIDSLYANQEVALLDQDERERVAAIAQTLSVRCGLPPVEGLETAVGTSLAELATMRVKAIVTTALASNPNRSSDDLEHEIGYVLEGITHEQQRLAVLDGLLVRVKEELVAARRAATLEALTRERARHVQDALRIQLSALYDELEPLSENDDSTFREKIDSLIAAIGHRPEGELEEATQALRASIVGKRARKSVYDLVVKTLRQQGYDEVDAEASQALGPAAIRRRYFRRAGDEERLVEFAYGADDAFSVETVRVSEPDIEERQADREAQQELCNVMKRIEAAMRDDWRTTVLHQGEVGEPMAVRTELQEQQRRQTSTANARRTRVR
jgi:hypothetical protein